MLIGFLYLSLAASVVLKGTISSVNDVPFSQLTSKEQYCVVLFEPQIYSGVVQDFDLSDVYAGRGAFDTALSSAATGQFSFNLPPSIDYVGVLAYQSPDCKLDLSIFPAVGWYRDVRQTFGMQIVSSFNVSSTFFQIDLHSISPFPSTTTSCCGGAGLLTTLHSQPILRLKGTRKARGYAHGCLLYKHIVSHFRFFTLEQNALSSVQYLSVVVPFVEKHYKLTPRYAEELTAVLEGMQNCSAAAGDSNMLFIPELDRQISLIDLYYLNSYGTYSEWSKSAKRRETGHCSQFAFWGKDTADGETIAARNMDGENDFRKVTVANVLIFSVTPDYIEEPAAHSFAYVVWPGFITSASGLSDTGIHIMGNDGPSNPNGPEAYNATSDMWVQREVLAYANSTKDIPTIFQAYQTSTGGVCISGCNLFIAAPRNNNSVPALAYEGDRLKGVFREADQAPPYGTDHLMVTNHFLIYGFDPLYPLENFRTQVSFSSLWRYAAGQHRIEEWNLYGHQVDFNDLVHLLQMVCHGSTEHSMITFPAQRIMSFAKADMITGGWYAPFKQWTNFTLDELFAL